MNDETRIIIETLRGLEWLKAKASLYSMTNHLFPHEPEDMGKRADEEHKWDKLIDKIHQFIEDVNEEI